MSNKKAIIFLVAALAALAVIFAVVALTASTPKAMQPPVNKAPSPN